MNEVLIISIIISITVALAAVLTWLVFENRKLKQRFNILSSYVERNNKDIAGLCSAAISVDSKLSDSSVKLNDIAEKVTDIKQHDQQASQPYQNEIQRVRDGASAEELIQQCGLSRDEAVLLIKLHGGV
jgi:CII-binding regulator of phage lambda lysogenization HflD